MPVAQTRLETLQVCKLLQCIRERDKEQIEKLTANGVPHLVNYNEPREGDAALHIAAANNDDDMIEFLLDLGAHPDVVDFKGRSAVMRAAEFGHVQCMEKLAEKGADMKIRDLEGKGVLFYCIAQTKRHAKCLDIALQFGSDVNCQTLDGVPVFLKACETAKENEDMCLMLLKKGADPNSKQEKTSRTALMAAAASGSAAVVRAILERGADVNVVMTRTKIHAAHEAAKGGFFDVLVVMAAYGVFFDPMDDKGNNPLHFAAKAGNGMACKFLGQRGCNPKSKNNEGNLPKQIAKDEGHKEALKECKKVEKSFGKTGKNNDPWRLELYDFCYERQQALLETFKKFDADGNGNLPKDDFIESLQNLGAPLPEEADLKRLLSEHDKSRDGNVDYNDFLGGKKYINKLYLMSAFDGKKKKKKKGGKGKKAKKTKVLMPICTQQGGERMNDGGPPAMFFQRHIHYTDSERFDRESPPEHPLQDDSAWYLDRPNKSYINVTEAIKRSDIETLKDAFSQGRAIDVRDKYYKTPLMVACSVGSMDMVKFMIEQGASVHAADNFKWTPLHFACHSGMKDIAEYLLENGANLEATTLCGATPLMRAIESSRVELVQYLIEKGAKVQVENKKGHNPVDIAGAFGDIRVYDVVRGKYDSLPPPNDKKKGKGGKGAPAKRPKSSEGSSPAKVIPTAPEQVHTPMPAEDLGRPHKGSILRAASALAGGIEDFEDIVYTPRKVWTKQPTMQELLCEKQARRDRFTWEVDFDDFKMPFLKNIENKVVAMGGEDEDD